VTRAGWWRNRYLLTGDGIVRHVFNSMTNISGHIAEALDKSLQPS
jgi:hypothetical protein